jgi:hypothetical protein
MVDIVGVFERMGQHEARVELMEDVDRAVEHCGRDVQRIVAGIHELDLGAEDRGGLGLRRGAAP